MIDTTDDAHLASHLTEQGVVELVAVGGGGRGEAPPVSMPIPPDGIPNVMNDPPSQSLVQTREAERTPSQTANKRRSLAAAKHVEYVQHLDRRLRSTVSKMMLTALRGPEVAANGAPEGMSRTELRIARDAMIPEKDAPVYLRMASRILDGYKRAEVLSERDPAPRLNVETIQVAVSNTYNYEVISAPEQGDFTKR